MKELKKKAEKVTETKKKTAKSEDKAVVESLVQHYLDTIEKGATLGAHTKSFIVNTPDYDLNVVIKVAKV